MLGERGMWFKQTFFERSIRVPLLMRWPSRFAPRTGIEQQLRERTLDGWDPEAIHRRILESQRRRLFLVETARRSGRYPNWSGFKALSSLLCHPSRFSRPAPPAARE